MITLDLETRSYADLRKVGGWQYSRHATTEVIVCCYGIDEWPIQSWWPGKLLVDKQAGNIARPSMPYDLYQALKEGHEIEAHNVSFERSMWINVLEPEHGWPLPDDDKWRDTMAVAAYYSLPQALDKLCRALGLPGKDPRGGRLISRYSKLYLKSARTEIPDEDFEAWLHYCKQDVAMEQDISDFLGPLPEQELEIFLMDQEVNMRGLHLNKDSILDAMAVSEKRAKELADEFRSITGVSPSQNAKAREWFVDRGVPLENLQADYIEAVLSGKYDFTVEGEEKRALDLRRQFNRASTKKLAAMLAQRDPSDGRARFQTRYHGAGTGRTTGTGFQPLNLTKSYEDVPPDRLITDIAHRSPEWLDVMYGDAMEAVSKATRHHITAPEGSRLIAGDYVSVEAVGLACLAGEQWKIDAFRNRDPIYELMGCKIHDLGPEAIELAKRDKKAFKDMYPAERFDGKTGELAFGYQGALGAWRNFDPEITSKHSDKKVLEICKGWRAEHPATVQHWYAAERAAIRCVARDEEVELSEYTSFKMLDSWLSMRLASGKRLWYWDPQLRLGMPPWHKPDGYDPEDEDTWKYEDCHAGTCDCEPINKLTYMAQKNQQWRRVYTYGGKIVENETQGTCREILMPALLRLRERGYHIVLSVYDEAVSEEKFGHGSVEEYANILRENAGEWARDWPLNVDVWEGPVYKK